MPCIPVRSGITNSNNDDDLSQGSKSQMELLKSQLIKS